MEILVGTGGNQSVPINDPGVSRVHCKIEVLETGHISVVNLSAAGTYLNGARVVKRTLAKVDDTIQLGPNFTITVGELIEKEDYSQYTCHQIVRRKFKDSDAVKVFLDLSSKRTDEKMASYTIPVVKSALAYYYIDEGKYRSAQELIYEAGDAVYAMQDGSPLLQGVYATILAVCARLYLKAGQTPSALEAINGAIGIFDRLEGSGLGYTEEQKAEVETLHNEIVADPSSRTDDSAMADGCFCPECGTKVAANAVFCSKCGSKISHTEEPGNICEHSTEPATEKREFKVEFSCNPYHIMMFKADEELRQRSLEAAADDELEDLWEETWNDHDPDYEREVITEETPMEFTVFDEDGNEIFQAEDMAEIIHDDVKGDNEKDFVGMPDGDYLVAVETMDESCWEGSFEAEEFDPKKLTFKRCPELNYDFELISGFKVMEVSRLCYNGQPIEMDFVDDEGSDGMDFHFLSCRGGHNWWYATEDEDEDEE